MDRTAGQRAPREVVPGKQGSRILRIRQRQVEEDALNDDKDADREYRNAYNGRNPMDRGFRRPS